MKLSDFDFDLPEELIALEPLPARDGSRLLHIKHNELSHRQFVELPDLLRDGDLLVVNNSRVIAAALSAVRPARDDTSSDVSVHLNLTAQVSEAPNRTVWKGFARPGKRIKVGDTLIFADDTVAAVVGKDGAELEIAFPLSGEAFFAFLEANGDMPLPPYIARRRAAEASDRHRYQTIFADQAGSVAAPTAGLHFTDDVIHRLQLRGIELVEVTLHVGAGTFLPVTSDDVSDHEMHAEWGYVSGDVAQAINTAKSNGRRIVCVGTTSTRLIESAADAISANESWSGETDIFITPGYAFRLTDALVTNFHLPKSTLLMLISALAGRDNVLHAYREAVAEGYRFFSYGDACLIEKATSL